MIRSTNLRALTQRPGRHEHHLVVVAKTDGVQLEIVTASEPLYFAHVNGSDEWVCPLPSGDPFVDVFPLRTFVADATTGEDIGRYNHKIGEVLLHPVGHLHWPGRLRPPYAPMQFAPGMRKWGVSLVYCTTDPWHGERAPLRTDGDIKAYRDPPPPLSIARAAGEVARLRSTTLAIVEGTIAPANGAWVVDLATTDLHRLDPGDTIELPRALVVTSPTHAPDPVPATWDALPPEPFPGFTEAARLPIEHPFSEVSPSEVAFLGATIPRYWLARMLYRIALHGMRLGYVETYGGFYCDDGQGADDTIHFGIRHRGAIEIPRPFALEWIEETYRAIAPASYEEL